MMTTMTRRRKRRSWRRRRRRRSSAAPLLAAGRPMQTAGTQEVIPHPRGATPLGQGQRACHCGHQRRTWSLPLPQRKGAEGLLQRWSGPSKNETGLKKQTAQGT